MTLAERWNGTEWSIQSTPNPSGSKESLLLGVSCSSSASCTAVGTYEAHGRNEEAPLIEHWNGTEWSIQAAPNHGEPFRSVLYSVSCTSSTACIAVGDYEESSSPYNYDTLAERWNGTEWTLQSTPNPSGRTGESNYLTVSGVSCTASNACTAVGWYATKGFEEGKTILAERWNGTEWTIQSTPMPAESSGQLHDVSCTSSTACTAIGFYGKGSEAGNLTENWNGTAWSDHVQSGFNTLFRNLLLVLYCMYRRWICIREYRGYRSRLERDRMVRTNSARPKRCKRITYHQDLLFVIDYLHRCGMVRQQRRYICDPGGDLPLTLTVVVSNWSPRVSRPGGPVFPEPRRERIAILGA